MKSVKWLESIPKGKKHWNYNENPSILTLHRRLHRSVGAAKNYKCVKCNNKANDWALIGKKYTDKLKDYQPMCRLCHVRLDKSWLKRKTTITKRNTKGQILSTKSIST